MMTLRRCKMSSLRSITLICAWCIGYAMKSSTFFASYMTNNEVTKEESSPVINKMFHMCSMVESCNFVFHDLATSQYGMSRGEKDLPQNKKANKLWMKMKTENRQARKERATKKEIKSCKEAQTNGMDSDGIADLSWGNGSTFKAYCDMTTDGGGWTVFQRRLDGNVSFDRDWDEYVRGFGDLAGSFWLGLEAIHHLTNGRNATLRFDLRNTKCMDGYAKYSQFNLQGLARSYSISLGDYNGDVGDGMSMSNGMGFSTSDEDNDQLDGGSCVDMYGGPWWYKKCAYVRLNSPFPTKDGDETSNVMKWAIWGDGNETIIYSEVKLRE